MPAIISSIVILVPLWHSMMLRNSIFGFMDKACDRCICPYILGLKRWTIVQGRAIPMVTEKWSSQPSSRLSGAFRGKDRILITHPIRNVFQIIMPTDFWEKGNPPNHILPSKKWGSRTLCMRGACHTGSKNYESPLLRESFDSGRRSCSNVSCPSNKCLETLNPKTLPSILDILVIVELLKRLPII